MEKRDSNEMCFFPLRPQKPANVMKTSRKVLSSHCQVGTIDVSWHQGSVCSRMYGGCSMDTFNDFTDRMHVSAQLIKIVSSLCQILWNIFFQ